MQVFKKWTAVIADYPTEIKISESARAKHWKMGEKIPKKYEDRTKFIFDPDGILRNIETHEKVIKNVNTAGKPRMLSINAQKIYVGIHHAVRSKIVTQLHDMFHKAFKAQLPAKIDIASNKLLIGLHFHDVYHTRLPDLDNLANLFVKCGIDCLTTPNNPNQVKQSDYTHKLGIIPDDKIKFIPHIMYEFTNVEEVKDRKLEFNIYEVSEDFKLSDLVTLNLKDGISSDISNDGSISSNDSQSL